MAFARYFNLYYTDDMLNPDQRISTLGTINQFDKLSTDMSAWAVTEHNKDGTHNFQPNGHDLIPIGGIIVWHNPAAIPPPTGWLMCDGSQVSRTQFSQLFTTIGILYGAGDGATTFTLPSLNSGSLKYMILACGQ